jgi:hypothetical protein
MQREFLSGEWMSILDRLQLLVRSQATALTPARDGSSAPVGVSGPPPGTPEVTSIGLDQLEEQVMNALSRGDRATADILARQAANAEYTLTAGAFGQAPERVQSTGPATNTVEIPSNPYGLPNPPVRVARVDRDAPPAPAGWYEQPDAFARFDAWVAGVDPAPPSAPRTAVSTNDPLHALESRLRGDL